MVYDPEKQRRRLRDIIQARNLNVHAWCKAAGVEESTLRNFLKGLSNSLRHDTYSKLAAALTMPISHLLAEEYAGLRDAAAPGYRAPGKKSDALPSLSEEEISDAALRAWNIAEKELREDFGVELVKRAAAEAARDAAAKGDREVSDDLLRYHLKKLARTDKC